MVRRRDQEKARQLVQSGIDLNQAGKAKEAFAAYLQAMQLDPDNSLAPNGLALLITASATEPAQLDQALQLAERAIASAGDPFLKAMCVSTRAEVRLRRGELQLAIQDSVASLQMLGAKALPQTRANVFRRIGTARQFLGELDAAFEAYRLAVEADPADVNCRTLLARVAKDRGDHATALAEYTSAISIVAGAQQRFAQPAQLLAMLLNDRGCVRAAVGAYREAETDYQLAVKFDPQYPYAYVNCAFEAGRRGDRPAMVQYLDAGLQRAQQNDAHLMNTLLTEVAVGENGDVILGVLFKHGRISPEVYQKQLEGLRQHSGPSRPPNPIGDPANALPVGTAQTAEAPADTITAALPKARIVVFAANPLINDQLALGREIREITDNLRASRHRDAFEMVPCLAARPNDLLQYLNEYLPHIVHFSAHGSQAGEIILAADGSQPWRTRDLDPSPAGGNQRAVSAVALGELFRIMKDNIQIVVLNACYSAVQAKAINEHIDYVVGMRRSIRDDAAIVFAAAFYSALGFNRTVVEAFEQAKVQLTVVGIPEQDVPELLVRPGAAPRLVFGTVKPSSA
ncbi:CHAT domain-containing protein [Dactylosporangium sp. NPDC005555]|uniref:CHAT domain-containing tetratricopeptide repeat protein n=1 Tax=Dactylosporangium sp. NPDC005555 TaxID=3154889 RepID=UPI0033A39C44